MPSKTQPARGMRDFLPADVRRRDYVIGVVKEVYERYGFEPLETPAVENIETLMGKYGEEGNQLIFKILKRGAGEATGEADLALRYDLTVPLARVVAEHRNDLPKFFKRYQIQPVWRADRPARGRFREFYQCDVDAIGSRSMLIEAQLCAAVTEVLVTLGFQDFTIRLNHREILEGILDDGGISKELYPKVLTALDKFDKIGADGVRKELEATGMASLRANNLLEFAQFSAESMPSSSNRAEWNLEKLDFIERQATNNKFSNGINELRAIIRYSSATGAGSRIKIDPSLARGLSYYTGAIMEISVPDLAGSLGGGGRYDNLVGMFSNQSVPACGFSLGLERIIVVMTEREMFPASLAAAAPADVMIALWNEELTLDALALATELRAANLRVDLYTEADKPGKQFKYASERGIPFVAIIGADEKARDEVALKDLRSGEQQSLPRASAAAAIRENLESR